MLVSTFENWTMSRAVRAWGTNAGAQPLAFQEWCHFKEAFAPEVVEMAVRENSFEVRSCLDPFGGSGTTALACQFLGIEPTTSEVNPFLADLITAKLTSYNTDLLVSDLRKILSDGKPLDSADLATCTSSLPQTMVEPGVGGRWVFDSDVAAQIFGLQKAISLLSTVEHQRFFRIIVGGCLVESSNVILNGKGRRYRRNWEARRKAPSDFLAAFSQAAEKAILDIHTHRYRPTSRFTVLNQDSRKLNLRDGSIDLVLFSPPYPNSFDYTDVYNVELWMLGYLRNPKENRSLRESTLSSHVQIHRQYSPAPSGSHTLDATLSSLVSNRASLWSSSIPEMIGGYFADMLRILTISANSLRSNGRIWMVVGNSRYSGTVIPVPEVLIELASSLSLKLVKVEPFRSMRSSPQQGGSLELKESLVVFEKTTR